MKYESIDEFAKRVGKTRRTIYRFYNKYIDLHEETKKKYGRRLIPISHKKYWNTELLFDENKMLNDNNRMMRNLLDYLHENKNPLASKLWGWDWSLFIGINYKEDRGKAYCFRKMNSLYELLEKKYGKKTNLRMFFTTEPFQKRIDAEHNHVILYIENETLKSSIVEEIIRYFKDDRVYSEDYTKYEGGFHYIMKNGIQGEDWDILGNNLAEEGIKYENKGYQKAV